MGKILDTVGAIIAWGLKLRLARAVLMYNDAHGTLLAAAITYRMLFAVFAAVFLGFSFASFWIAGRDDLWEAMIQSIDQLVPGLVGTDGSAVIDVSEITTLSTGFTVASIAAVVALLWALVSAVGNLRLSLRAITGSNPSESMVITRLLDLLFALSIGVLIAGSTVLTFLGMTFTDNVLGWLGLDAGGASGVVTMIGTVVVTYVIDAVIIAWLFWLQSGVKVSVRTLLPGSLLGAIGLVALQQLSSLFAGGAPSNPLLTSFASLIALLLWFNLSAQVVLISSAFIALTVEESEERVAARYGAETLKQRAVRAAEREVRVSVDALKAAREAEAEERHRINERRANAAGAATAGEERR